MPTGAVAAKISHTGQKLLKHADGSRLRVLYAEDSTSSRIVTTAMLKRMGLDVDAVEDGELALRQAEKANYDVILLDIEMPVMDGVTAARGIRALGGPRSKTPILALSAFLADSTEMSQWRDAFDHALPKPANGNELLRAIKNALQSQQTTAEVKPPARVELSRPGSVASGLRASLPKGTWNNLVALAAMESIHYANSAAVAFEAKDFETTRRCAHALLGLARNFEAAEVEQQAAAIEMNGATTDAVQNLLILTSLWHTATKTGST